MKTSTFTAIQRAKTVLWHTETPSIDQDGLLALIQKNHRCNFLLWHEEDVARRNDIGTEPIYHAKRAIDEYNQQRNDFIEKIDKHLVTLLDPPNGDCPFNSETPGMIIDRLSILALKEYHMQEEADRDDAESQHQKQCTHKANIIRQQIKDLSQALDQLFHEIKEGTRSFRVYYQFKMYNDASLNPQLREAQKTARS